MASTTVVLVAIAVFSAGLVLGTAHAQVANPISLDEIAESYAQGDRIVISGSVVRVAGLDQITLKVVRGDAVITLAQLDVAQDGTFATILNTAGGVWEAGAHRITVTYHADTSATKGFELKGGGGAVAEDIYTADIGGGETVDVGYTITGGTVREIEIDGESLSLVVRIDAARAGSIVLGIDREYVDARSEICGGEDEEFIVIVDGTQIPYIEEGSDQRVRTIEIAFEQDESKIEVIGTCVVPEFGALALVVLAASTGAAVAASRRLAVP